MTKQQKFFLLVVLIVAGVSASIYVDTNKSKLNVDDSSKNIAENILDGLMQDIKITKPKTTPQTNNTNMEISSPVVKTPVQYINNVSYYTPSNMPEVIHVTVSILDGVISDISFSYDKPSNRESGEYLERFSARLPKSSIIGKSINNVSVSRVGGASLTTEAFMQAINETKAKVNG